MIDDQTVVTAERIRDDLHRLKTDLRARYKKPASRVVAAAVTERVTKIAEGWLVDVAARPDIQAVLDPAYVADVTVHFQRLLSLAEGIARRSLYDAEINAIAKGFTLNVAMPLKAARVAIPVAAFALVQDSFSPRAFVGHSFADDYAHVASAVIAALEAIGVATTTGEPPRAGSLSDKVKGRIEANHLFVGIFTRREKISGKEEWTTSPWVIDEKAYAFGRARKLILMKEQGVGSIGGIQGDYEFIEFNRERLDVAIVKLIRMFEVTTRALRA